MEPIHFSKLPRPRWGNCAYCGAPRAQDNPLTKEHMPPDCMCASDQRMTVPACEKCNTGQSDNVEEFRNFICLCGPIPNEERRALWGNSMHSFSEENGPSKLENLYHRLDRSGEQSIVYPMDHEFFRSIVRNQIRALSWWHKFLTPLPDDQFLIELFDPKHYPKIEEAIEEVSERYYVERGRLDYCFAKVGVEGFHSWWILRYFDSCSVVALVFDSAEALSNYTR